MADLTDPPAARGALGLGSAAVQDDTRYAHRSNNLSDLGNASTARDNLGLGSAATKNEGSGSGLDADSVDGMNASQFLRSDQNDSMSGALTIDRNGVGYALTVKADNGSNSGFYFDGSLVGHLILRKADGTIGTRLSADGSQTYIDGKHVWNASHLDSGTISGYRLPTSTGGVGSFAMLARTDGGDTNAGDSVSGSNIAYAAAGNNTGNSPSGTWRCMGRTRDGTGDGSNHVTVWQRIS